MSSEEKNDNVENQNNEGLQKDNPSVEADYDNYKPDSNKYLKEQEALKTAYENKPIGDQNEYKDLEMFNDTQEPQQKELFSNEEEVQPEVSSEIKQDPEQDNSFKRHIVINEYDDTKLYSALCHFSNVLIFTILWVPALIYYFKNEDEIIKEQAKQAALYGLTFAVIMSVLISISITIPLACCFLLPLTGLLFIALWGYSIYLTYLSYNGNFYDIPIIKDIADKINI